VKADKGVKGDSTKKRRASEGEPNCSSGLNTPSP